MVRRLGLVVAIVAGLAAAILLASDVQATYDGETASCTTVINAAAVGPPIAADFTAGPAQAQGLAAACHDALTSRTELAGLLVLICVAAGAVASFSGRPTAPPDVIRTEQAVTPSV